MWVGFALNAASGLLLFAKEATTVGVSGVFWVKMSLIALAVWVLTRLRHRVFGGASADTNPLPRNVRALAFASIVLWAGAITAGRLMAYVGPTQAEAGITFGSE